MTSRLSSRTRPLPAFIRRIAIPLMALLIMPYLYITGCGTGPFEQCLGQADCPNQQTCQAGKCTTPSAAEPKAESAPDAAQEHTTPDTTKLPEPAPEVTPEPLVEPVPEATPEPVAERAPDLAPVCTKDSDCQRDQVCQGGKCESAPQSACIPTKFSGELIHPIGGSIKQIAIRPDGQMFAVFSDGLLRLHDSSTGQLVSSQYLTSQDTITRIFWSTDSKYLAATSAQETLLWSATYEQITHRFAGIVSEFTPDSKALQRWDQASASIISYDVSTGTQKGTQKVSYTQPVQANLTVLFAPGGAHMIAFHAFKEAVIVETATAKEVARIAIAAPGSYFAIVGALSSDLFAVQVSDSAGGSKTVIYSIKESKEITSLPGAISQSLIATNGKLLFYANGTTIMQLDLTAPTSANNTNHPSANISAMALQPRGASIWYAVSGALSRYKSSDGSFEQNIQPLGKADANVRFHPTKDLLMTDSDDGLVKIWDPKDIPQLGRPSLGSVRVFPYTEPYKQYQTGFLLDELWQQAFSYDSKTLIVRDATTGKKRIELVAQATTGTTAHQFSFVPGGKRIAGLLHGTILQSWDLATGTAVTSKNITNAQYKSTLLAIHPKTGMIATKLLTSQYVETVSLWDPETLQEKWRFDYYDYLWSVAFAPTQAWLAVLDRSRRVHIIDVNTGKVIQVLAIKSGNGALVFGPQSKHLAVRGGVDVEIFATDTWKKVQTLAASTRVFAIDPTESLIAIATVSGEVELYDIKSGSIKGTLISKDTNRTITSVSFSADGQRLTFMSKSTGRAQLWSCSQ